MSVKTLLDLGGKVALVTGASRGLGLQIATGLGEMCARLVLASRKAADIEAAAAGLKAAGVDAASVTCDLANPQSLAECVSKVLADHGKIDILVNNAGAT